MPPGYEISASGVYIVKHSELKKEFQLSPERMLEAKTEPYVERRAIEAVTLLDTRNMGVASSINNNDDPLDISLKPSLSDLKLAFIFNPIKNVSTKGYAAGGMWIPKKGWTAATQLFSTPDLKSCDFFWV